MKIKNQKKTYPSKRVMNLAIREKTMNSLSRVAPTAIVLAVLIGCFAKFGVYDRLHAVDVARQHLYDTQSQLDAFNAANEGYDEIAFEYSRRTDSWMTAEESSLRSRTELLALLESEVFPIAALQNLSVKDNVLSLNLTNVTLEQTSAIVAKLEAQPSVADVTVYTAGYGRSQQDAGSVSMTIAFWAAEKGGEPT